MLSGIVYVLLKANRTVAAVGLYLYESVDLLTHWAVYRSTL